MNQGDEELVNTLQDVLKGFVEKSFPKKCASCGREYADIQEFLDKTLPMGGESTGLIEGMDYRDNTFVDFMRNCPCGTSMFVVTPERRDSSPQGQKVREAFGNLMHLLIRKGLDEESARLEVLKVVRGGNSEVIDAFKQGATNDQLKTLSEKTVAEMKAHYEIVEQNRKKAEQNADEETPSSGKNS